MSTEENKALVQRMFEELYNKGNLAIAEELFAPDFVNHVTLVSLARFSARGLHHAAYAFPDLHLTIEEMVAEGDTIVSRTTLYGTHQGPFQGIPPTGRSFQ